MRAWRRNASATLIGPRRVVGDDQAQRLQRHLVVAGFLGAVGDLGRELAVLLVGVQRVAERGQLPGAVAGQPGDVRQPQRAARPAPATPCPCARRRAA